MPGMWVGSGAPLEARHRQARGGREEAASHVHCTPCVVW